MKKKLNRVNVQNQSFGTCSEEEHCIIERREKKIVNNDFNESYAQSFYLSKFSEGKTNSFVTSRVNIYQV